jgi:hypothetical protein
MQHTLGEQKRAALFLKLKAFMIMAMIYELSISISSRLSIKRPQHRIQLHRHTVLIYHWDTCHDKYPCSYNPPIYPLYLYFFCDSLSLCLHRAIHCCKLSLSIEYKSLHVCIQNSSRACIMLAMHKHIII